MWIGGRLDIGWRHPIKYISLFYGEMNFVNLVSCHLLAPHGTTVNYIVESNQNI